MAQPHKREPMRARNLAVILGVVAVALVGMFAFDDVRGDTSGASAAVAVVDHPGIVPSSPESGYPIIRTDPRYWTANQNCGGCLVPREVFATDQVGDHIVSGGNFTQIQLRNGTVHQQRYFTAWHIATKQPVCVDQLSFDNEVTAIEPGPTSTQVYVGGRFNKVTGADGVERTRTKLALVDLADCSVDRIFVPGGLNGKVSEIVNTGDRLFIGGDFTSVAGNAIETIAEIDPTTAAVDTSFVFTTSGELSSRVRGMGVNPAATRLIVGGRFGTMSRNGTSITSPTVIIDISNPQSPNLTAHRYTYINPEWGNRARNTSLQDVSISPDGTKIGLAFGTATVSDYVYLVPAVEQATSYSWRHYSRDSNFSVALSNNAMYIQGHFCKIDAGPGPTQVMSKRIDFQCSGDFFAGGAFRTQIAALSLTDGTPLTWNPGHDSYVGGRELTITPRGLLAGFDGEYADGLRTGALAFYDFGAPDDAAPPSQVSVTSPAAGTRVQSPVSIEGTATDDIGVSSYIMAIRRSDGTWLQSNDTFAATYAEREVAAMGDGSLAVSVPLADGTYLVRTLAKDAAGQKSIEWGDSAFEVGPPIAAACNVVQTGGDAVVTWNDIDEDIYVVRLNGAWLATINDGGLEYTHVGGDARDPYSIRYWKNGAQDVTCVQGAGDPAPEDPACVATQLGPDVEVTWTAVPGKTSYTIRLDGAWLATVNDVLSYTHAGGDARVDYVVRWFDGGAQDMECEQGDGDPPPAPPSCTATVVAGGVKLDWTAVPGETQYVVRKNNGWLATVDDALTHTDPGGVAADDYVVRWFQDGPQDMDCD